MTDKKLEPIIEYYDDGKIKCAYSVDENGYMQGPYEEYRENGQFSQKCTFKDDKLEGPYEGYDKYGQLEVKYTCKNGKKEGSYESYYKNGQLKEECTFKNGETDGPYVSYYENGQLFKKCTYKDGECDGPLEHYHPDGRLMQRTVYENGKALNGQKAEEYLEKWKIQNPPDSKPERKGLNARLAQMDKQMPPTQLRQSIKRAEVAKFRAKFPNKKDGR